MHKHDHCKKHEKQDDVGRVFLQKCEQSGYFALQRFAERTQKFGIARYDRLKEGAEQVCQFAEGRARDQRVQRRIQQRRTQRQRDDRRHQLIQEHFIIQLEIIHKQMECVFENQSAPPFIRIF